MTNFSSFSFIFVGDSHGFINDFKKQKEIIEKVEPEFILSEQLENNVLDSEQKYKTFLKDKKSSKMTSFKEIKDLVNWGYTKKIKLIGIDFENFGLDLKLRSIIKGKGIPSKEDRIEINKILSKRNIHHLKLIRKYSKLSKKPLVILLGTWHLREESLLMKSLNNYIVIYPSNEEGKLLIEPPKDKIKIKYFQRIKNE